MIGPPKATPYCSVVSGLFSPAASSPGDALRQSSGAARMASNARAAALDRHGRALMNQRYEDLFLQLAGQGTS